MKEKLLQEEQKEKGICAICGGNCRHSENVCPVFDGFTEEEFRQITKSRCIHVKKYEKGDVILRMDSATRQLGVVMQGSVIVENTDFWGNHSILTRVGSGQMFAESYAISGKRLMIDCIAAEKTIVRFVQIDVLRSPSCRRESWYPKMMDNLLMAAVSKNMQLSERFFFTESKKVRTRLMTYLSNEAVKQESSVINIPFDRQQLADYLNLDRSALSKELGRMRDDGLITFRKNHFELHEELLEQIG